MESATHTISLNDALRAAGFTIAGSLALVAISAVAKNPGVMLLTIGVTAALA